MDQDCITIVIGNPGVGKSTLLNCILGEEGKFQSGVSFGGGKTQILQACEKDGRTYMDTPGLSDKSRRLKAAEEIEKGLKQGGQFKIFFMITLEAGRIKSDDKTTMKLVLDAAPQIDTNYSVIINKLKRSTLKELQNDESSRDQLLEYLNEGLPGTSSVHYSIRHKELDDRNNKIIPLDHALRVFIQTAPTITIAKENVRPIQVDKFEEIQLLMEELQRKIGALESNLSTQANQLTSVCAELQQSKDKKPAIYISDVLLNSFCGCCTNKTSD